MHRFIYLSVYLAAALIIALPAVSYAIDQCEELPKGIQVKKNSAQCGQVPTVILKNKFRSTFSAAFRWDDGSKSGQDRSPFALKNPSASSSPYKTQKRIRKDKADYLCYGKFLNRKGYPVPVQLTLKPSAAPVVKRYCVSFGGKKENKKANPGKNK